MKKFLSILLAVLVLGACGTATMDAKKKVQRKAKAKTTAVSAKKVADDVDIYCSCLQEYNENAELGGGTILRELDNIMYKLRPKIRAYEKAGKLSEEQKSRIKRLEAEYNQYN